LSAVSLKFIKEKKQAAASAAEDGGRLALGKP
jgi:hypothetical protein